MRRLFLIILLFIGVVGAQAQTPTPRPGDPPVLSRITISPPSTNGMVTITGSNGAVFPNAYVAVRNLYTGEAVYVRAGTSGGFTAQLFGPGNTPFWISPSDERIDQNAQSLPGSLPGGPGVILYGLFPDTPLPTRRMTQIAIDGDISDWDGYSSAQLVNSDRGSVYALRNSESLYVGLTGTYVKNSPLRLELRFSVDLNTYTLTLDPRQAQAAELTQVNPLRHGLGEWIVAARQASAIEVRIPLSFSLRADRVSLDSVRWLDSSGGEFSSELLNAEIPPLEEIDGIFRPQSLLRGDVKRFSFAGALGESVWSGRGRVETLDFQPGDSWQMEMDITLGTTDYPANVQFAGEIALQPIARSVNGQMRVVGGVDTNNGWSSILTPSGLPIDNLRSSVVLGEAVAEPFQLVRGGQQCQFSARFYAGCATIICRRAYMSRCFAATHRLPMAGVFCGAASPAMQALSRICRWF